MPFSQAKLDQLCAGIENALSSCMLNEWERNFLKDMRNKLQRYGRRTRLSEKQYKKLMALTGSELTPASSLLPLTKPKATPWAGNRQARRSKLRDVPKSGFRPRRPRVFRRSFRLRSPVFLLAVGVVAIIGIISENAPITQQLPSEATELRGSSIGVIDGDTVRVPGQGRRIRLVGFNTPEVFSPGCSREKQLGQQASQRLRELLRAADTVEFNRVACSCKPGTEGTDRCNYGRLCGTLKADGVDVGQTLISEGLAARYRCGRTSCPPPPGNWCG